MKQKKTSSKILFRIGIGLILVSIVFLFVYNIDITNLFTYAQKEPAVVSLDETMFDIVDILQPILKLIYILMRPLLVIAGSALDNTFVYGEFLHLDAPLRQIWNIVKNFANFALGFVLLIEIFSYVFSSKSDTGKLKGIFTGAIISGVGINLSWVIVGMIIDISTIATYSIGGLPMTMINKTEMGNKPILGVETSMNLSEMGAKDLKGNDFSILYKWGDIRFLPCQTEGKFIVGPMGSDSKEKPITGLNKKYCLLDYSRMVNISKMMSQNTGDAENKISNSLNKQRQEAVKSLYEKGEGSEFLKGVVYFGYLQKNGNIQLRTGAKYNFPPDKYEIIALESLRGKDKVFDWEKEFNRKGSEFFEKGTYLGNLIEDSKGFVGPLVTLYTSLMNLGDLHVTSVGGGGGRTDYATFFEFLVKAVCGILLIFPLIAMAIVFIMRIGYIWLYVVASPIIILGLGFKESWLGKKIESFEYFKLSNIMGMIFSPVISVFALSISILFLFTLQDAFHGQEHSEVWKGLGIEISQIDNDGNQCMNIFGLFETCYNIGQNHQGGSFYIDLFAWLIMNGFGIAIVRVMMFMALNSNDLAKNTVSSIEKFGKNVIKGTPIVPIPGVGTTSVGAIDNVFNPNSSSGIVNWANSELRKSVSKDRDNLKGSMGMLKGEEQIKYDISNGGDINEAFNNQEDYKNSSNAKKAEFVNSIENLKLNNGQVEKFKKIIDDINDEQKKVTAANTAKSRGHLTDDDIKKYADGKYIKRDEETKTLIFDGPDSNTNNNPTDLKGRKTKYDEATDKKSKNAVKDDYKKFVKEKGKSLAEEASKETDIKKVKTKLEEIKEFIIEEPGKDLTVEDIFGVDKIKIAELGENKENKKEYKIEIDSDKKLKLTEIGGQNKTSS